MCRNTVFSEPLEQLQTRFDGPLHCASPRTCQFTQMDMMFKVKLIYQITQAGIVEQLIRHWYFNKGRVDVQLDNIQSKQDRDLIAYIVFNYNIILYCISFDLLMHVLSLGCS